MEDIVKCILLSIMMGISCKAYYEIFVPYRKWRNGVLGYLVVLTTAIGFMMIAFTEIPPYIFQPIRFIAVVAVSAQICFQIKAVKNLILAVMFCGIYWILSMICVAFAYAFPVMQTGRIYDMVESITGSLFLCLMLLLRYRFKKRTYKPAGGRWRTGLAVFPLFGMMVIMAISMMPGDGSSVDKYAKLMAVLGFSAICFCLFLYVENMLEKEEEVQNLRLMQVRTQNQMNLYRGMQKNYEQHRRMMHDYKNQLNCIQGMVSGGQSKEALEYISKLTGSIRSNADYVNTNHTVVNVVLNQKYQEAYEKGITITMAVNDMSGLTMSEEEIVILLVNLIDNAMEACERLTHDKIIQFKMMLEDDQLVLSIRNPVEEAVKIKGKLVPTSKRDGAQHGIGLMNVDSVIRKNGGTSVIKCEDGWFYFSALI